MTWTNATKFHALRQQVKKSDFEGCLLALDPGETTGWALLEATPNHVHLVNQGQVDTWPLERGVLSLECLAKELTPDFMVYEAYHVYAWRLNEHKFSEVPTIQIIGCAKTIAIQYNIPYGCQTAQVGKGFWSDDKLKRFDLFFEGQKHARDALRHGLQFLLFGLRDQ